MNIEPGNLISVASIVAGFGITVLMFRVQRELAIQASHPKLHSVLAWSDYLIIASVCLALLTGVGVLLLSREVTLCREAIAAASCAAAVVLQVGYIPGILFHYGIQIGADSTIETRNSGQPGEKPVVICFAVLALVLGVTVMWRHLHP